jgi:hypothetical protein
MNRMHNTENAVNMAKSLLKHWSEKCSDLSGADESDDCIMEIILRSIVNAQNAQIQIMRDILAAERYVCLSPQLYLLVSISKHLKTFNLLYSVGPSLMTALSKSATHSKI